MATNIVTNVGAGWVASDNKSGIDLNNPNPTVYSSSAGTTPENPGARLALGTRVQGANNSEWIFVVASATVSQNSMVGIDANFNAAALTTTIASSLVFTYGICQIGTQQATNCQPGDYFWALLRASGGAVINVVSTALKGAQLYIYTGQAGALSSTASGTAVKNIYTNTTISGATLAVDVVIPAYMTVST